MPLITGFLVTDFISQCALSLRVYLSATNRAESLAESLNRLETILTGSAWFPFKSDQGSLST